MKIVHVVIENYKSVKCIDIDVSSHVNVFIGENSVGKSNIFSAIEWVLGSVYPSFNNFPDEYYFLGDTSLPIKVALTFDDGCTLEMATTWFDRYGRLKTGLNLDHDYVSDDLRQKYVSASIGSDRKLYDNPAMNRWTLMGRLLLDINRRFNLEEMTDPISGKTIKKSEYFRSSMKRIQDHTLFSVKDDNGENLMEKFIEILGHETARQLNRQPSDFHMDLNVYDPWNFYRTLQIMVDEAETGMTFRASDLGMGVQASIMIAILKAYSQLKLKNQTPIIIDEPELYLHPQGRRNFYNIIRSLADSGTQVFLTTHSSEFVDLNHFDEIHVVRKDRSRGTYIRQALPSRFVADLHVRYPNIGVITETSIMEQYMNSFENTGDSQKSSEAMFARKIILVEGESEVLILPYLFELLGYDLVLEGVTVVRCGGKNEIDRFYRLYSEFGIPCYVIFDGDYHNIGKDSEKMTIKSNRVILGLFGVNSDFPDNMVTARYLGFKYRLEENLGIGDVGSDVKALKLYQRVKNSIRTANDVPSWVSEVIEKIKLLPLEADSVLKYC